MVIILNHYPKSLETLSFRPPSSSANWLSRSTPPPTTITTTTENLAAAQTSQWDRLPLQREPVAPRTRPTPLRTSDNATRKQSITKRSPLEINTSMFAAIDYSSASSVSASTLSEMASSSDTDREDATNEPDSDVVPKTEDDEATSNEEIKRVERSENPNIKADEPKRNAANPKKRRGRPRKNPPSSATTMPKAANGRSKTGCLTCRRRKKKCDEAKPSCNNCQKNAVVCEGYPQKGVWRSGKQRSDEVSLRRFSFTVPRGLPFLLDGIETDIDRRFLDHFVYELSQVLTLHDNTSNPFKDILLPMATQHKGLMHSLMALSGSHIVQKEPKDELNERQQHHSDIAVTILLADITKANQGDGNEDGILIVEDPTIASTIIQCLLCVSEGLTNGEYRAPFEAARLLITDRKSENPEFQQFIWEFFTYHDVSNSMTSLARQPVRHNTIDDQYLPDFVFQTATQPRTGVLVGVFDGLCVYLQRITALRDNIRARKAAGLQPVVLYEYLSQAVDIDAAIHSWESNQEPQTPRWIAAELFRQCTWVYLYRTIQASKPNSNLCSAVDSGLEYLRLLPPQESTTCLLLLPLFILGCAAFEPRQRPDLEDGFDILQGYSNLGNIKPARQIVRRVWEMMDVGDERSWDWETIMADMGLDLLVT